MYCSELFNLPLPALWTVVLGEHNRKIESGDEQRISVDKIVMHQKYHNFQHDLGKMMNVIFFFFFKQSIYLNNRKLI